MKEIKTIIKQEMDMEERIKPVLDMYKLLGNYSEDEEIPAAEQEMKNNIEKEWKDLIQTASNTQDSMGTGQTEKKVDLVEAIKKFRVDVAKFRVSQDTEGPNVDGITPKDAAERLRRFKEEFELLNRNYEIQIRGEKLFGIPHKPNEDLESVKKEINKLNRLQQLQVEVTEEFNLWNDVPVSNLLERCDEFLDKVTVQQNACKKLTREFKEFAAYNDLKNLLETYSELLPLFMQICEPKTNMQDRHWLELNEFAVEKFDAKSENFKMEQLIKADFIKKRDDVEEVISAAVNQNKIWEIIVKTETKWNTILFDFTSWKGKASIFSAGRLNELLETLMDDTNTIAAIQSKKHVKPFIEQVLNLMQLFDQLERTVAKLLKVQQMWCALEVV